jgi:hypothetical protein
MADAFDAQHDFATMCVSISSWCGTKQDLQVQSGKSAYALQPGQDTDGGFRTSMTGCDNSLG